MSTKCVTNRQAGSGATACCGVVMRTRQDGTKEARHLAGWEGLVRFRGNVKVPDTVRPGLVGGRVRRARRSGTSMVYTIHKVQRAPRLCGCKLVLAIGWRVRSCCWPVVILAGYTLDARFVKGWGRAMRQTFYLLQVCCTVQGAVNRTAFLEKVFKGRVEKSIATEKGNRTCFAFIISDMVI